VSAASVVPTKKVYIRANKIAMGSTIVVSSPSSKTMQDIYQLAGKT